MAKTNNETAKDDFTSKYERAIRKILKDRRTVEIIKTAKTEDPNGYREMYKRISDAVPLILEKENCIKILPMIVYGWMPTILGKSKWDESIVNLLGCKPDELLDEDLDKLLHFVNDSFIGVSKLLHFTNPKYWAIWDSNVYAAIEYVAEKEPKYNLSQFLKPNYSLVNNKKRFIAYQTAIREVSKNCAKEIRKIEKFLFEVSEEREPKIRIIEECLFYVGRDLESFAQQSR